MSQNSIGEYQFWTTKPDPMLMKNCEIAWTASRGGRNIASGLYAFGKVFPKMLPKRGDFCKVDIIETDSGYLFERVDR